MTIKTLHIADEGKDFAKHSEKAVVQENLTSQDSRQGGNTAAKMYRRTKTDDPSKYLHDYWRKHYEI
jgi:hypothetical protein